MGRDLALGRHTLVLWGRGEKNLRSLCVRMDRSISTVPKQTRSIKISLEERELIGEKKLKRVIGGWRDNEKRWRNTDLDQMICLYDLI